MRLPTCLNKFMLHGIPIIVRELLVFGAAFGLILLRILGAKSPVFQAAAHIYAGWLIGLATPPMWLWAIDPDFGPGRDWEAARLTTFRAEMAFLAFILCGVELVVFIHDHLPI